MPRLSRAPSLLSAAPDRLRYLDSEATAPAPPPWRRWYATQRWQDIRRQQFAAEPLCRKCKARGEATPAKVCDHIEPHRGDEARFWAGPFQSLCKPCHDGAKQREEQASRHHGGIWA